MGNQEMIVVKIASIQCKGNVVKYPPDYIRIGLKRLGITAKVCHEMLCCIAFKSQEDLNLCILSGIIQEYDIRPQGEKLFTDKLYRWNG
jgi:hypothetical protein